MCGYCADAFVSDILARRPDLRALLERPPAVEDDDRDELDRQIQADIDRGRLDEYLKAIREGDDDAIVACSQLLKVAVKRGTLPQTALKALQAAIREAA